MASSLTLSLLPSTCRSKDALLLPPISPSSFACPFSLCFLSPPRSVFFPCSSRSCRRLSSAPLLSTQCHVVRPISALSSQPFVTAGSAETEIPNLGLSSSPASSYHMNSMKSRREILSLSLSPSTEGQDVGPIELPPLEKESFMSSPVLFEGGSLLQTVASFGLTGAITVLLVRSLRRRTARAKEEKIRSMAVERLNKLEQEGKLPPTAPVQAPPSALNTLGGALVAGSIAFVLYNFTSGVEDTFGRQAVSTNYTIRNITITVRTIVTGVSWLATFVFGVNAAGLLLYAVQLAFGLADTDTPAREQTAPVDSKEEKPSSTKDRDL